MLGGMWWLRGTVMLIAAVAVLAGAKDGVDGLIEVAIGAAALCAWRWAESRPDGAEGPRAAKLAALVALAACGGVAVTSRHQGLLFAFGVVGVLSAGSDLAPPAAVVVLCAGVLGIEAGAVSRGVSSTGAVLGYPGLLVAFVLAGRYRRSYRLQAEQAEALLTETRRAQAEEQHAAALLERSRIAREIHDVLGHSLGALGIQLQAAEALLSERGDVPGALNRLAGAQRLVAEGLEESRRAVHALRSDTPPLPESIAAVIGEELDGTPPARLVITGEPYRLAPAAGLALLRVAQEALVNARKHARGHDTVVTLEYAPEEVRLVVANAVPESVGPVDEPSGGGYGLAGMRERLKLIGGTLSTGVRDERWVVEARAPARPPAGHAG